MQMPDHHVTKRQQTSTRKHLISYSQLYDLFTGLLLWPERILTLQFQIYRMWSVEEVSTMFF